MKRSPTSSKLNDASQSYVDMLDLTSLDELTDKLRSKLNNQDKARINKETIFRILKKHNIPFVTISNVKFLTPYAIDKFMEKQTKNQREKHEES